MGVGKGLENVGMNSGCGIVNLIQLNVVVAADVCVL